MQIGRSVLVADLWGQKHLRYRHMSGLQQFNDAATCYRTAAIVRCQQGLAKLRLAPTCLNGSKLDFIRRPVVARVNLDPLVTNYTFWLFTANETSHASICVVLVNVPMHGIECSEFHLRRSRAELIVTSSVTSCQNGEDRQAFSVRGIDYIFAPTLPPIGVSNLPGIRVSNLPLIRIPSCHRKLMVRPRRAAMRQEPAV